MTNALGYIRVSGDEEKRGGASISLDAQAEAIRQHCAKQKPCWHLTAIYRDEGVSGTRHDRPGLQQMLRDIDATDAVIVWDLDRLTRAKSYERELLLRDIEGQERTRQLVSIRMPYEPTPEGDLLRTVVFAVSHYEALKAAARIRFALDHKARKGEWSGRFPYGYQLEPGEPPRLTIVESRADVVRLIYQGYLDGIPRTRIARDLNDLGSRTATGGAWGGEAVKCILGCATYAGLVPRNGEFREGEHEAIIARDTWDRTQKMAKARQRTYARHGKHLLSGILRCSACGERMSGATRVRNGPNGAKNYGRYVCARRAGRGRGDCLGPTLAESILFPALRDYLKDDRLVSRMPVAPAPDRERVLLERELAAIPQRRQNFLDAVGRGTITDEDFREQIMGLKGEEAKLSQRLETIQRAAPPTEQVQDRARAAADILFDESIPLPERQQIAAETFERIDWKPLGRHSIRLMPIARRDS